MAARELTVTRRVIGWLRLVAPPYWAVILYLVVLLGLELFAHTLLAPSRVSPFDEHFNREMRQIAHTPRDVWLAIGFFAWSFWRVGSTHPFYQPPYAAWLELTPWRLGLPLPAGPIHLVPQDGVVLGLGFLLLQHAAKLEIGWLFAAFAIPYLGVLMLACATTYAVGYAYAIAFGLALAIWLRLPSLASIAVLIALYPIAMLGVRRSLSCFPWGSRSTASLQDYLNQLFAARAGWPYVDLAPGKSFARMPWRDALVLPWLASAWLVALASNLELIDDRRACIGMGSVAFVLAATLGRWLLYVGEVHPPVSLLGRIATGRLLIPKYDRVWIPFLLGWAVVLLQMRYLRLAEFTGPFALAIGLTIQFGMGPSLKTWALTSPHRLRLVLGRSEMIEL